MKKTKLYNHSIPEEVIKKTLLKKGEVVRYRLHNIGRSSLNPNMLAFPVSKNVPPVDSVYLPEEGMYVDIAAVRSVDAQGNHTFHEIEFRGSQAGQLILTGGRANDQEIHSYLSLSDFNASKEGRDETKEPIFEKVDEEAKAESLSYSRNLKREALNSAADLSVDDIRNYIAARGGDDTRPIKVLRNELEELADADPQAFMDLLSNTTATHKATLQRALTKGAIMFNAEQSRYEWPNKEPILTVARGDDAINELVSFCISSPKGEKILQTISSKSKK
jgi:uncharacterized protein (DUF1778 family)